MATVARYGIPPKKLFWKKVQSYGDWEFNEDLIVKWFRESCTGHIQYDFTTFQGAAQFSPKTVELTAWFQNKADAENFQRLWMK